MIDTAALLTWFDSAERPLPWRRPGTSAWGVLLSEVMSQQTPVARVAPVWEEWMERWPTPADFAAASRAEVLRAWGKLGYPRRALRLWECAQEIGEEPVPSDVAKLLALPGIGEYTARAVACFHYGRNVPVVDTNVRRVYARAVDGQFLQPQPSKKELAQVEALLPAVNGPRFSAALMELGALVCTAKSPKCEECPLRTGCAWQLAGCPQQCSACSLCSRARGHRPAMSRARPPPASTSGLTGCLYSLPWRRSAARWPAEPTCCCRWS